MDRLAEVGQDSHNGFVAPKPADECRSPQRALDLQAFVGANGPPVVGEDPQPDTLEVAIAKREAGGQRTAPPAPLLRSRSWPIRMINSADR